MLNGTTLNVAGAVPVLSVAGAVPALIIGPALSAGVSKVFGIATPKAMAMHNIGMQVTGLASILLDPPTSPAQALRNTIISIGLGHFAGKALAKKVCGVDVTAKDVLKLACGWVACVGAIVVPVVVLGSIAYVALNT